MNPLVTPRLHVTTRPVELPGPTLFDADLDCPPDGPRAPLSWVRRGQGMVAWGTALDISTTGPERFAEAAGVFRAARAASVVRDEVRQPGTGLVAFGSLTFAPQSRHTSHLVVPQYILGVRDGQAWLTTIHDADHDPASCPPAPHLVSRTYGGRPAADFLPGALSAAQWMQAVRDGVGLIESGQLDKVVLARDEIARVRPTAPDDAADSALTDTARWDTWRVLADLAAAYPSCWTFAVGGLLGATPELLVRTQRGLVTSRVLAGTIRRDGDDQANLARAATLARSSKDLEEHQYAVESVAKALGRFCTSVAVPEVPYVLHLPNVMHLASDVSGVLVPDDVRQVTSLELAGELHPSAAVCGTPREAAAHAIEALEAMDRGRYAGPVGWMGADGDGEWGIALRCAQLNEDGSEARLFAGGGIVAGSRAPDELAETEAKFLPMRRALAGANGADGAD